MLGSCRRNRGDPEKPPRPATSALSGTAGHGRPSEGPESQSPKPERSLVSLGDAPVAVTGADHHDPANAANAIDLLLLASIRSFPSPKRRWSPRAGGDLGPWTRMLRSDSDHDSSSLDSDGVDAVWYRPAEQPQCPRVDEDT